MSRPPFCVRCIAGRFPIVAWRALFGALYDWHRRHGPSRRPFALHVLQLGRIELLGRGLRERWCRNRGKTDNEHHDVFHSVTSSQMTRHLCALARPHQLMAAFRRQIQFLGHRLCPDTALSPNRDAFAQHPKSTLVAMNIQDVGIDLEFSRRKLLAAASLAASGAMAASLFAPKRRPTGAIAARASAGIAGCRAAPAIWCGRIVGDGDLLARTAIRR